MDHVTFFFCLDESLVIAYGVTGPVRTTTRVTDYAASHQLNGKSHLHLVKIFEISILQVKENAATDSNES